MDLFIKTQHDSRNKQLPLEVYESVVRSLHGDTKTLFLGSIATCSAAVVAWYHTNIFALLICACLVITVAISRAIMIRRFNKKAQGELTLDMLSSGELNYRYQSAAYVGSLGLLCLVSLATTTQTIVHLIVISATLANVAGISGRNFASEKVINLQTFAVTIPLIFGLIFFGGPYHIFLACLLLPFLLAIQSISARLRNMLFDATFAAMDNKTIADRFEVALENASHGMAMLDSDGVFQVVNERFNKLFGISADHQTVGSDLRNLSLEEEKTGLTHAGANSRNLASRILQCLIDRKKTQFNFLRPDGNTIEVSFNPMSEGSGVVVIENISERIKSDEEIRQLANYDTLTHLPNRRYFTSIVKNSVNYEGENNPYSVFFADLDNFKNINDSLGHPVGDKLLCAVSLRMKSCLPEDGLICRFGGDEFVIVLPGKTDREDCNEFANKLIEEISKPILIDGHLIIVGSSVGIALCPENETNFDQLLKMADVSLYEAKSKGRGIANFYSDELGQKIRTRRKLEVDLRRAVQKGELSVHYQPLIDIKQNRVSCCEALVRWKHPEKGFISPSEFIPMAEEIGMIAKIGKFVLEEATRECMRWPDKVRVAVNVSSLQFQQSDICGVISQALEKSGLEAGRLEIEVTESAALEDLEETSRILRTLAQGGVRISLDDFGTGFSSLSYLHQLPLDKVKIDRSFIESIRHDKRSLILLSGVTKMAADLGLLVIVEGVEEEDQLEILKREVHLDQVQGFLFSKALPGSEIRQFLPEFGSQKVKDIEKQSA